MRAVSKWRRVRIGGRGGDDGVSQNTVYGWLAKVREGGKDSLKAKAIPGRPAKLGGHRSRGCTR